MTHKLLRPELPLSSYKPPIIGIDCLRCHKGVLSCDVYGVRQRFGNITVGQLAQEVAALSTKSPCGLALSGQCSARALEPPVWDWADLDAAMQNGWIARLHCRRHIAALKRTSPCPEVWDLDLETLVTILGYDFKLAKLPRRCKCPKCHTELVDIEWIVPLPKPPPYSPASEKPVTLRFRRSPTQVAHLTFNVVDGRKAKS